MDDGVDGDQGLTAISPDVDRTGRDPRVPARRRVARFFARHRRTRLGLTLSGPLLWLVVVYMGALVALLITSLYHQETVGVSTDMVTDPALDNYRTIVDSDVYRTIALRTISASVLVTVIDLLIALPLAFFMAKVASTRVRRQLVIAVTMPLWMGYLIKGYAWRAMLNPESGFIREVFGITPGYGFWGTVVTLSYLWLPYMVIPIYAGLDRLPTSLLEASTDLGAKAGRTFSAVVLPLIVPSVIAGSIFTFSLTLGDFYMNRIMGGTTQFIGNAIYTSYSANLPLAAAYSTVPILIMIGYLVAARSAGALDEL